MTVKVADEVWIIAALVQSENPNRSDFTVEEIMDRARPEKLSDPVRPGFYVHVIADCKERPYLEFSSSWRLNKRRFDSSERGRRTRACCWRSN